METRDQSNEFEELPDQGGFVAGFSLGLIAGAAAYFLFGTEKGSKLRKQLVEEWDSAREFMAEDGVLKDQQVSLRQFLQNVVEEVFHTSLPQEIITPHKARKQSTKQSGRRPKRSHKFSGV